MAEKLPKLRVIPRPKWQLERLALWIEERSLELRLRDDGSMSVPSQGLHVVGKYSGLTTKLVRDFDKPVKAGQIRILSPELTPDTDRPVFVAVFGCWDVDEVLVAPFSPFTVPAIPGEWLTGRSTPMLRVLEIWNARSVPNAALNQSWLVDELTDAECEAAWCVFEHDAFGKPLDSIFEQQIGPPLAHPEDPRRQYQHEEVSMLTHFQSLAESLDQHTENQEAAASAPIRGGSPRLEKESWRHRSGYMPISLAELALAASSGISPTAVETLLVGEAACIELVEQVGQPHVYRALVISDPLQELSGAEILSGDEQTVLARFIEDEDVATAKFPGHAGILVRLADRRVVTPVPKPRKEEE